VEGEFVLEDLDPNLLFRLLVAVPGYVPRYSDGWLDPLDGAVELELEARDLDALPPESILRGRVVDPHGRPVSGAVLAPRGKKLGRGTLFGGIDDVDTLAITDRDGSFALACSEPGSTLLLEVSAPALASRMSPWIAAGRELHTIPLDRGVTVTGIVHADGKPLGGVELGMVQEERSAEAYLGEKSVGTTAEGRFTFVNVPARDAWSLYGLMASFASHGALAARAVRTGDPETTVDLGVLDLEVAHRLAGRVELVDGSPLPGGVRLLLGREEAWDQATLELGPDGSFAFDGLPSELYTLDARIAGYTVSPENGSFDFLNHQGLLGRVDEDLLELVVLFEPGAPSFDTPAFEAGLWERYEALRKAPLRGVEAASDH